MAARGARDRGGFGQQQREELGVAAAGRVCCSARRRALVRGGVRILGLRRARVGGGGRRSAAARGSRGRNSGVPRAACRGAGPARHRSSPAAWICSEPRRGRRERERGRGGGEAGQAPAGLAAAPACGVWSSAHEEGDGGTSSVQQREEGGRGG